MRARLAEPEPQLVEQPLALSGAQVHRVRSPQMLRQQRPVPQVAGQPEAVRAVAQVRLQRLQHVRSQLRRTPASDAVAQPVEAVPLVRPRPALHRARVLAEQQGRLPAALAVRHQQKPVQTMVVLGLVGAANLLLYGKHRRPRVRDLDLPHHHARQETGAATISKIMRHYLCRCGLECSPTTRPPIHDGISILDPPPEDVWFSAIYSTTPPNDLTLWVALTA